MLKSQLIIALLCGLVLVFTTGAAISNDSTTNNNPAQNATPTAPKTQPETIINNTPTTEVFFNTLLGKDIDKVPEPTN